MTTLKQLVRSTLHPSPIAALAQAPTRSNAPILECAAPGATQVSAADGATARRVLDASVQEAGIFISDADRARIRDAFALLPEAEGLPAMLALEAAGKLDNVIGSGEARADFLALAQRKGLVQAVCGARDGGTDGPAPPRLLAARGGAAAIGALGDALGAENALRADAYHARYAAALHDYRAALSRCGTRAEVRTLGPPPRNLLVDVPPGLAAVDGRAVRFGAARDPQARTAAFAAVSARVQQIDVGVDSAVSAGVALHVVRGPHRFGVAVDGQLLVDLTPGDAAEGMAFFSAPVGPAPEGDAVGAEIERVQALRAAA